MEYHISHKEDNHIWESSDVCFGRSHLVHICKLRKLCWKGNVLNFKVWWFVLKVPDNPSRFFMHHLHEEWKKNIIGKWRLKRNKLINRKVCFILPSNWSCSKYTHFRWNKFLHGIFEFIIENCNSRKAELSIADMQSSVPSVINNSEQLIVWCMQQRKDIDEFINGKI